MAYTDPQWAVDRIRALELDRDRYVRALNSLEKAVTDHIKNCIDCDEDARLTRAHRAVMRKLAERSI